jgi:hypothetical protein
MLKADNGELVFNSVDFKLECKRPKCKDNPHECVHIFADMPAHLSVNKAQRVKALMSGEEKLMLQETRGIESDPNEPQFPLMYLDKVFDKNNRYTGLPYEKSSEIHICLDPSGGGSSRYAMTSFVRSKDKIILVGIESKEIKDVMEQPVILIGHIQALFRRKEFQRHIAVLTVESNYGFEAGHAEALVHEANLQNRVCVVHEANQHNNPLKKTGVLTTNASKHTNAFVTRFNFQNNRYAIANEVTCVSGIAERILTDAYNQLSVYSKIVEPPKTLGGKERVFFTGKHVNGQDDISIVWQMQGESDRAFNSPAGLEKYRTYHEMCEAVALYRCI